MSQILKEFNPTSVRFVLDGISASRKELRLKLTSFSVSQAAEGRFLLRSAGLPGSTTAINHIYEIDTILMLLKQFMGSTQYNMSFVLGLPKGKTLPVINYQIVDKGIDEPLGTRYELIIKILNALPPTIKKFDTVNLFRRAAIGKTENVYFFVGDTYKENIPGTSLDYEVPSTVDTVNTLVNSNASSPASFNEITASLGGASVESINSIISSSKTELKIDYSKFENHTFFGSAKVKLENFKRKVSEIEDNLIQLSQSLTITGSDTTNAFRITALKKIQEVKNTFTGYEEYLYYDNQSKNLKSAPGLGQNFSKEYVIPVQEDRLDAVLKDHDGFPIVYKHSGSTGEGGENQKTKVPLFNDKYFVEKSPFYGYSGSIYLSYLIKASNSGLKQSDFYWENYQSWSSPPYPYDSLYQEVVDQNVPTTASYERHIYLVSASYWEPSISNLPVGPGYGVTQEHMYSGSGLINTLEGADSVGEKVIIPYGVYAGYTTARTGSGAPITASFAPAGELFRLGWMSEATSGSQATASYITDIKITKKSPVNTLPFSKLYSVSSSEWKSWYDTMYTSASAYDDDNINSLRSNLPRYIKQDLDQKHTDMRRITDMWGEHYDVIKNYIDNYYSLFNRGYEGSDSLPVKFMPLVAKNLAWDLSAPLSGSFYEIYGDGSAYDENTLTNMAHNIWQNVINNIVLLYKTRGTRAGVNALLSCYQLPSNVVKLKEFGSSNDKFDLSVISQDYRDMLNGLTGQTGSVGFQRSVIEFPSLMVPPAIENTDSYLKLNWGNETATGSSALEFIIKPHKSTGTQIIAENILSSSGHSRSNSDNIGWDLLLEPSASSDTYGRLTFRLNNSADASASIQNIDNRVSMSTDYLDMKGGTKYWNVVLQKETNGYDITDVHDYKLITGRLYGDKIKNLSTASLSVDGDTDSITNKNFISGSSTQNLHLVRFFSGSIAEVRTWKDPVRVDNFKKHILSKTSVVGNTITSSRESLIYHFRLNEGYTSASLSSSADDMIPLHDSNPGNNGDHTFRISSSIFNNNGTVWDFDVIDDYRFGLHSVVSEEEWESNMITIAPEGGLRLKDNLTPERTTYSERYHSELIPRNPSTRIEFGGSPQDVINAWILDNVSNFDFNDYFAHPEDYYNPTYKSLISYRESLFNEYNISLDINKYIRNEARKFNSSIVNTVHKMFPARVKVDTTAVTIKPSYIDRVKVENKQMHISPVHQPESKILITKDIYSRGIEGELPDVTLNPNLYAADINFFTDWMDSEDNVSWITASRETELVANINHSGSHQSNKMDILGYKNMPDIASNWGTSSNHTHFWSRNPGRFKDHNTGHYEERNTFYTIGDVEIVSGSRPSHWSGSWEVDFENPHMFANQEKIKINESLGFKPLGRTHQLMTSSDAPRTLFGKEGQFLGLKIDNKYWYPRNHYSLIGARSDIQLDTIAYKGTINDGTVGGALNFGSFNDLTSQPFYTLLTNGDNNMEIERGSTGMQPGPDPGTNSTLGWTINRGGQEENQGGQTN